MLKHQLLRGTGSPVALLIDGTDGTWKGPDLVLTWGRGSACVFLQDAESPIWIPEWLLCPMDSSPDHQPWPTGTMGPSQESTSAESVGLDSPAWSTSFPLTGL